MKPVVEVLEGQGIVLMTIMLMVEMAAMVMVQVTPVAEVGKFIHCMIFVFIFLLY